MAEEGEVALCEEEKVMIMNNNHPGGSQCLARMSGMEKCVELQNETEVTCRTVDSSDDYNNLYSNAMDKNTKLLA